MESERWNRVDQLLQSALDIAAVERDAYLARRVAATCNWRPTSVRYSPRTTAPTGSSALRPLILPHANSPKRAARAAVSRRSTR